MKESIGGANLLLISITILLVIVILLSASIGYTKAFKARNAIVNIIQKYGKYDKNPNDVLATETANGETVEKEIDRILTDLGYMQSAGTGRKCRDSKHYTNYTNNGSLSVSSNIAQGKSYNYCIFWYEDTENKSRHYGIETYMYFELPVFGKNDRFVFPIYVDTYTFFKYGVR